MLKHLIQKKVIKDKILYGDIKNQSVINNDKVGMEEKIETQITFS